MYSAAKSATLLSPVFLPKPAQVFVPLMLVMRYAGDVVASKVKGQGETQVDILLNFVVVDDGSWRVIMDCYATRAAVLSKPCVYLRDGFLSQGIGQLPNRRGDTLGYSGVV